jgi:hypothetical protein
VRDALTAVLGFIAFVAVAAAASRPPATPPKADAAVEIHSYGEPAADLRELLTPFLGERNFAESRRASVPDGQVASVFRRPDGDRVFVLGGPNCLVVGYFATRSGAAAATRSAPERAARFIVQLKHFLEGLPAPRPQAADTGWSRDAWCRAY